MGKSERDKGNRGEQQVVNILKKAGFDDAVRNYADKVDEQGVDVFAGNLLIQVKNYKKYAPLSKYDEIKRSDGFKALVTKGNRKPWMIAMTLEDFLAICQDIGLVYDDGLIPPF